MELERVGKKLNRIRKRCNNHLFKVSQYKYTGTNSLLWIREVGIYYDNVIPVLISRN